jgi:hypothetical protein
MDTSTNLPNAINELSKARTLGDAIKSRPLKAAADSTPYSATLDSLSDAIGDVDTYINGVSPSPVQATLLAFLQGPLAQALQAARNDLNPA